jgi:cob(I)alamin adenosyltransferase
MKLYTKRGDDGSTDLFGGVRLPKDSLRFQTIGTVDELNAVVGLALAGCSHEEIGGMLTVLQSRLFEIGADLSTPLPAEGSPDKAAIPRISAAHIAEAEGMIDRLCEPLEPMRFFILPGGSELSARLHHARTVARRAERDTIALSRSEPVSRDLLILLNRLSDLFFAMARRANQLHGVGDVPWTPRQ